MDRDLGRLGMEVSAMISPTRRFTLLDGMIFVAATAAGLALSRIVRNGWMAADLFERVPLRLREADNLHDLLVDLGELFLSLVVPLLAAWTLAAIVFAFRCYCPPLRRLARRPGTMACLVASATFLIAWTVTTMTNIGIGGVSREGLPEECALFGTIQAGFAVMACWATLILCRIWRPEPTWLDRMGRLLGVCRMILGPLYLAFLAMHL
jgi:hypothetical protein